MKITPMQLFALSVAGFAAIFGANLLFNYKSLQTSNTLSKMDPRELFARKSKMVAEENMTPAAVEEDDDGE